MSKEQDSLTDEPGYIKALKRGVDGAEVEVPREIFEAIDAVGPGTSLEEIRARIDRLHDSQAQ